MASAPRSDDPLELLAATPPEEYALLELGLEWEDRGGIESMLGAALRLFVITRDPLGWIPGRGNAWATVNSDGDVLELPVYVTHDEVQRRLVAAGGELTPALAALGETVVTNAARCEGIVLAGAYPDMASRGALPRLLDNEVDAPVLGTPVVSVQSEGWEPIGLGAIQDLVQDAFGPVDLDRSAVALRPVATPRASCPACAGERFGFPADLGEAQAMMCADHQTQADDVTASRLARAQTSNPAGWRATGKASARINGLPDPPGSPLPQRLVSAPGRNDPCPCGSGRKYKHCCGR